MMNGLDIETLKQIESEFGKFDIKQVMGGSNDVYLRFGYWRRINIGKLQEIIGNGIKVVEDDIDDDDCGTLWSYKLK
jgi:hypothetical protein